VVSSIEIAKKHCIAGILRAQNVLNKRRVPYYHVLPGFLLVALFIALPSRAQSIQRYEGILVDNSGSIGKSGTNSELFREYLFSTKKLLLSEPPNSRVWVAAILISTN
jgi:hypothetical protein